MGNVLKKVVDFFVKRKESVYITLISVGSFFIVYVGQISVASRYDLQGIRFGGEYVLCFVFGLSLYLLFKSIIEDLKKDNKIPKPINRFTKNVNGKINVQESRIEELIVYVYELEEYIERH